LQCRHVPSVRRTRSAVLRRLPMSERASLRRWNVRRMRRHGPAVLSRQRVHQRDQRVLVRKRRDDLPGVRRPGSAMLRRRRLQRRRLLQRQPLRGERRDVRQRNLLEWLVRRLRRPGRGLLFVELHVGQLHVRPQCRHQDVRSLRRHRRALLRPNAMRPGMLQRLFDVRRRRRDLRDGPGMLREQPVQLLRSRGHRRVPRIDDLCQWRLLRCGRDAMRRAG